MPTLGMDKMPGTPQMGLDDDTATMPPKKAHMLDMASRARQMAMEREDADMPASERLRRNQPGYVPRQEQAFVPEIHTYTPQSGTYAQPQGENHIGGHLGGGHLGANPLGGYREPENPFSAGNQAFAGTQIGVAE